MSWTHVAIDDPHCVPVQVRHEIGPPSSERTGKPGELPPGAPARLPAELRDVGTPAPSRAGLRRRRLGRSVVWADRDGHDVEVDRTARPAGGDEERRREPRHRAVRDEGRARSRRVTTAALAPSREGRLCASRNISLVKRDRPDRRVSPGDRDRREDYAETLAFSLPESGGRKWRGFTRRDVTPRSARSPRRRERRTLRRTS